MTHDRKRAPAESQGTVAWPPDLRPDDDARGPEKDPEPNGIADIIERDGGVGV